MWSAGSNKLLKLKAWLTAAEAARHLSILFGEEFTEADILRLALDRHLTLSVNFGVSVPAQLGRIIQHEAVDSPEDGDDFMLTLKKAEESLSLGNTLTLGKNTVFSSEGRITYIDGIWDLPLIGAERSMVEREYKALSGNPIVNIETQPNTFVNHSDGVWARIAKTSKEWSPISASEYSPADELPLAVDLVVRTSALQDLKALISEPEPAMERPVGQRERTTLLVIIAALANLARVNIERPSAAAAAIESQAALMGVRVGVRTIEEKLKLIPEALQSKADT